MRRPRIMRGGLGLLTIGWLVASVGCTHNYYYGAVPACGPTVMPSVATNGAVCDVPAQVSQGGTVVSNGSSRATIVSGTPVYSEAAPPRVVVSEPTGSHRLRWRRADPEPNYATTRVEGGISGETISR